MSSWATTLLASSGGTGLGNEQTAILGTTALRSIRGLSKASLEQSRLRTQSRDQSCRDLNHLRTLHVTRLRGVVASLLPQRRNGTKIELVRGGIGRVFSPHCVTRGALSHISKWRGLSCKCALVQGLKALSTGSEVQSLECSTEFFAVLLQQLKHIWHVRGVARQQKLMAGS